MTASAIPVSTPPMTLDTEGNSSIDRVLEGMFEIAQQRVALWVNRDFDDAFTPISKKFISLGNAVQGELVRQ
jgi:hypothetical protein